MDARFRLETAELNGQTRSVRILMNDEARHSWGLSWDTMAPYHMENPNSVVYPNHPIEVWGNVIDLSMVWMRFIPLDDIPILSKRLFVLISSADWCV